jgi:hypothetical protein
VGGGFLLRVGAFRGEAEAESKNHHCADGHFAKHD